MIASVDEPIPTVLGLLCIGTLPRTWIPGSYIQFLRIRGTKLSDPIADELEISGTISEILRRLDEKLTAHLTTGVDFTSQDKEVRSSPYPLVALQQLARNAVMHRTYENTNAPVRVYWFDDRIEISNPGGPYGSITVKNFGEPGYADYRNPQLASAFKSSVTPSVLGRVYSLPVKLWQRTEILRPNSRSNKTSLPSSSAKRHEHSRSHFFQQQRRRG